MKALLKVSALIVNSVLVATPVFANEALDW